jgi:hypothetical protein
MIVHNKELRYMQSHLEMFGEWNLGGCAGNLIKMGGTSSSYRFLGRKRRAILPFGTPKRVKKDDLP